jgi:hypothetical protein
MTWIGLADFNADGKLDIAVTDSGPPTGNISVLLGNGDGTFQPGVVYSVGYDVGFITPGDFNGDRLQDFVVGDDRAGGLTSNITVVLNTGVVSFSPTIPVSFPLQLIGTTSSPHSVTLKNNSSQPLSTKSITQSGRAFSVTTSCLSVVAPHATCKLSVRFSPVLPGPQSGTISIVDSASSKPQVIELVGQGTVVEVAPTSILFPEQKVGTRSARKPVTLTNLGASALAISSILVSGTNASDFSESNDCGSSVAAGASCTVNVVFIPSKTGVRTAKVYIHNSGGASPQTISLSGTGD